MATYYEIPIQAGTPQTLSITLGGTEYQLSFNYRNCVQGGWTVDISDAFGNEILFGVPLVTGCDLLAQYAYLNFGGGLFVQTTNDPDAVPTFENLGDGAVLYWVTGP